MSADLSTEPVGAAKTSRPHRIGYWVVLTALAAVVLGLMVVPVRRHAGINDHPGAGFHEMLEGAADFPFRTRVLLPWVVNAVDIIAPESIEQAAATGVSNSTLLSRVFLRLHWEPELAFHYLILSFLMLFCFVAFAHLTALLTLQQCGLRNESMRRLVIAVAALLGVPAFYKYTSFLYDPAQLIVSAAALYCLATNRLRQFILVVALGALNKETNILFIPLSYIWLRRQGRPDQALRTAAITVAIYLLIRVPLYFTTVPPSLPATHLFDHNIAWLIQGYGPVEAICGLVLAVALGYRWAHKPALMKLALAWLLVPLLCFGIVLGFIDEWRDYFEVYPACVALVTHTIVGSGTRPVDARCP